MRPKDPQSHSLWQCSKDLDLSAVSPDQTQNARESTEEIARDIAAVNKLQAVPTLLEVLCETTGMGFAAVARVSDSTWTACAVKDDIGFGLKAGGQLDLETTLCIESSNRPAPTPVTATTTRRGSTK
jgi:hypothetical protein